MLSFLGFKFLWLLVINHFKWSLVKASCLVYWMLINYFHWHSLSNNTRWIRAFLLLLLRIVIIYSADVW